MIATIKINRIAFEGRAVDPDEAAKAFVGEATRHLWDSTGEAASAAKLGYEHDHGRFDRYITIHGAIYWPAPDGSPKCYEPDETAALAAFAALLDDGAEFDEAAVRTAWRAEAAEGFRFIDAAEAAAWAAADAVDA